MRIFKSSLVRPSQDHWFIPARLWSINFLQLCPTTALPLSSTTMCEFFCFRCIFFQPSRWQHYGPCFLEATRHRCYICRNHLVNMHGFLIFLFLIRLRIWGVETEISFFLGFWWKLALLFLWWYVQLSRLRVLREDVLPRNELLGWNIIVLCPTMPNNSGNHLGDRWIGVQPPFWNVTLLGIDDLTLVIPSQYLWFPGTTWCPNSGMKGSWPTRKRFKERKGNPKLLDIMYRRLPRKHTIFANNEYDR